MWRIVLSKLIYDIQMANVTCCAFIAKMCRTVLALKTNIMYRSQFNVLYGRCNIAAFCPFLGHTLHNVHVIHVYVRVRM